ncbi:MAG: hypothetical protein IPM29_05785 [Planctomycetes bacterium]|nr:hypothetical protein [Planctomycetota bacterium]
MNSLLRKSLIVAGVAVPLLGWLTFSGSPRWPLSGGFHYVADLNTTSFPAGSVWDNNAQWALSDWRDMGDTSFLPAYTRTNSDFNDHGNGRNSWVWLNRPSDTWLGVTYVRWSGSTMVDCDIWYNSRPDYTWTNGLLDPCVYRSYWPVEFRSVARHEAGHAIGFDHENDTLANMNSVYQHGNGIPHIVNTGVMPHADEKAGCRTLYPASDTVRNVMATNWREPAAGSGSARQETEETGNWAAGTSRTLEFWLSNQSNVTIPGFSTGIRTGIYLSTNTTISTFDTRIYETTYAGDWGAHASGRYTPTVTVPDTMPAGSYYIGVFFDNNASVAETGAGATESDNTCILGQVTVTNNLRTLSIDSVNAPGVGITVSLADSNGNTNGNTPFSRTYWGSTQSLTLTAPSSVGNNDFRYWLRDGVIQGTGTNCNVTMNANHTAVAVYWNNVAGRELSFGQRGCPGSGGVVPVHDVTHGNGAQGNQMGTPTQYRLSNAFANSQALIHFGLSSTSWNGTRLPLALDFIGMNGCWLNHDIITSESVSTSFLGTATFTATWPVSPSAVGASIYTTFAVLDRRANPLGVVHSNSMRTVLGGNIP